MIALCCRILQEGDEKKFIEVSETVTILWEDTQVHARKPLLDTAETRCAIGLNFWESCMGGSNLPDPGPVILLVPILVKLTSVLPGKGEISTVSSSTLAKQVMKTEFKAKRQYIDNWNKGIPDF